MDHTERSRIQEKAAGTEKRNELIRSLHAQGENMAELGRQFKLSRQAVRRIVKAGLQKRPQVAV